MKIHTIVATFVSLALLSAFSFAAGPTYQAGKIIKVEKQESRSPSSGTDAPLKVEVATYRISIQLDDKIYICQYKSENEISWVEGKDVEARVSGKSIYVKKASGKEARGSILSTAAAEKP
jgi:hypothetical protein